MGEVHVSLTFLAEINVTSKGHGTSFMCIKNNYFRRANENTGGFLLLIKKVCFLFIYRKILTKYRSRFHGQ